MDTRNFPPVDFQKVGLERLTSVMVRPVTLFANDIVTVPATPSVVSRTITMPTGGSVEQFCLRCFVNGELRTIPLKTLFNLPSPLSEDAERLAKMSSVMDSLVRCQNAAEMVSIFATADALKVTGFFTYEGTGYRRDGETCAMQFRTPVFDRL